MGLKTSKNCETPNIFGNGIAFRGHTYEDHFLENNFIDFNGLFIEKNPPHKFNPPEIYDYERCMQRICTFGSEYRLPFSDEIFSFLIAGIEGNLSKNLIDVCCHAMNYGEWLEDKLQLTGDTLSISRGNIKHTFDIQGIQHDRFVDLKQFPDAFVKLMYSRPFEQLPNLIKKNAQIWLPFESKMPRPIARSFTGNGLDIIGAYGYNQWFSRCVYEKIIR